MRVVVALVAAAPAQAAPPWSRAGRRSRRLTRRRGWRPNEIDQSVLVPRVSAGKMGAAPQLVQWRGGGGRPGAGGAERGDDDPGADVVDQRRALALRGLADPAPRREDRRSATTSSASSSGTGSAARTCRVRHRAHDRRAALDPLDAEAGRQRGRLGDRGVASHRAGPRERSRSPRGPRAGSSARSRRSPPTASTTSRSWASGSTRAGARSSRTRATRRSRSG